MTVSKQVRAGLPTVFLPPVDVVIPGADPENLTDEQDIEYNQWCNEQIIKALRDKEAENSARVASWDEDQFGPVPDEIKTAMVLTEYPHDTSADGDDSRDVVALDRDGDIVVVDSGVR